MVLHEQGTSAYPLDQRQLDLRLLAYRGRETEHGGVLHIKS
jgi:hypothetical protein